MPQLTLRETTLNLLKSRPDEQTLINIAIETGLNFYWLQSFLKSGHKTDPGSDKIMTLFNHLSPEKLPYKGICKTTTI